ncbi:MAG: hypothetical protein N4A61_07675 [Pelagimonas sp.]|jgi:hypothetical protein|nr:hypothetical protein [Pelagimonas sp.]
MMMRLVLVSALVLTTAGCSSLSNLGVPGLQRRAIPTFDGHRFNVGVKTEGRKNQQAFVASVRGISRSPEGAIQAAAYHATRHCLKFYGTSDIDWTVGPDQDPATLAQGTDSLSLSGRCRDL